MNRTLQARCHGFSLVETLLALSIASSAVVAVIGLLAVSLSLAQQCRTRTAAGQLAQRLAMAWRTEVPPPHLLLVDQSLKALLPPEATDEAQAAYDTGSLHPAAAYFARISAQPASATEIHGTIRLLIRVESPASAPAGRRKVHHYVTLALP